MKFVAKKEAAVVIGVEEKNGTLTLFGTSFHYSNDTFSEHFKVSLNLKYDDKSENTRILR